MLGDFLAYLKWSSLFCQAQYAVVFAIVGGLMLALLVRRSSFNRYGGRERN